MTSRGRPDGEPGRHGWRDRASARMHRSRPTAARRRGGRGDPSGRRRSGRQARRSGSGAALHGLAGEAVEAGGVGSADRSWPRRAGRPAIAGHRPSERARFPPGERDDGSRPPARPAQPTIALGGPDPDRPRRGRSGRLRHRTNAWPGNGQGRSRAGTRPAETCAPGDALGRWRFVTLTTGTPVHLAAGAPSSGSRRPLTPRESGTVAGDAIRHGPGLAGRRRSLDRPRRSPVHGVAAGRAMQTS